MSSWAKHEDLVSSPGAFLDSQHQPGVLAVCEMWREKGMDRENLMVKMENNDVCDSA